MTTNAEVRLWGRTIGAVSLSDDSTHATFEYDLEFAHSGIEIAPLMMPLAARRIYAFRELPTRSFHGLPGLLADSLPDRFGNALIEAWLASVGLPAEKFNAVQRLCYAGSRAIGALEFEPAEGPEPQRSTEIQVAALVELAAEAVADRAQLRGSFSDTSKQAAIQDILRVGTSAGGARAKAVIAWNPQTNEVRSGQLDSGSGFEHWLLKFDGVTGDRDKNSDDSQGFGTLEYAYYLMALAAGIEMSECRLFEENGRRHFMTRRFDRPASGDKLHMQSLGALAHYDFYLAGAYSYEQALLVLRQLGLSTRVIEQQFRRMAFNILARNQDDHVKNIAFLMDRTGTWTLSPAFDLTYSFNQRGEWTSEHQMTLNGKRRGFTLDDFRQCAKTAAMKRGRAEMLVEEVHSAVERWPEFASQAGVTESRQKRIQEQHRLALLSSGR